LRFAADEKILPSQARLGRKGETMRMLRLLIQFCMLVAAMSLASFWVSAGFS